MTEEQKTMSRIIVQLREELKKGTEEGWSALVRPITELGGLTFNEVFGSKKLAVQQAIGWIDGSPEAVCEAVKLQLKKRI
jgi:hypothetical protein